MGSANCIGSKTQNSVQPIRPSESGRFVPNNEQGKPSPGVIADTGSKTDLTVTKVDLNIPANSVDHKTNSYDICKSVSKPQLVVRRGQTFVIVIELSQEFNEATHDLRIIFEAGEHPLVSKGTSVVILLSSESKNKQWGATLRNKNGNKLTIAIQSPPNCLVAKWAMKLDVIKKATPTDKANRFELDAPIIIVFNPWCKDDTVYLSDNELLKEYVMNEIGKLYSGSQNNITTKPWNYGQFETCVLDVALHLLDVSKLKWEVRGNPVNVVRKLSALVNSNDDDGVVSGSWSGKYTDGSSPVSWTGSPAILEQFWKTKRPVKYGQCWVFSAVCTSICRALGIPCRSVTNFQSAHDTDGSITIDVHHRQDGSLDETLKNDSIWNFHVWNEAWMARPDLQSGYGGWQAFDATPQETSSGVFCCGPVPVTAIKQGEVTLPYDGQFVFAEVNADRVHWRPTTSGTQEVIGIDRDAVGKHISTKAANSGEREDITSTYKAQEGSEEERAVVIRANQLASNRKDVYQQKAHDVEFTLIPDKSETFVGGKLDVSLKMKNSGSSVRTLGGRLEVRTMFYTGVLADLVKSEKINDVALNPGEDKLHQVRINFSDYDGKLKDSCMLDVTVMISVKESDQIFVKKETYRFRKPHLTIKGPTQVNVGQEINYEIFFTNPLAKPLTKCFLLVDGVSQSKKIDLSKVPANSVFNSNVTVKPTKSGKLELIAVFNSKELDDINGSLPLTTNTS